MFIKNKRLTRGKGGLLNDKDNFCLELEDVGEVLNKHLASIFIKCMGMEDSEIGVEYTKMPDSSHWLST